MKKYFLFPCAAKIAQEKFRKKCEASPFKRQRDLYNAEDEIVNKIYLLLVIDDNRDIDLEEYSKTGHVHQIKGHVEDWILNEEIGIDTISGFKLTEEEAKSWALERCKLGEELPDKEVSEEIVPFEKLIYVDHQTVLVEPNRWEKHVKFKGYRREDLELPVFGYLELLERPEK